MTRQNLLFDRGMTSSKNDTVVRSSTEDHVVELSRDMSVADHHTHDPDVGLESPVLQDRMDSESSVQNSNLQSSSDIPIQNQSSRVRPMSSKIYNPLPFKKNFLLITDAEKEEVKPSENISPLKSKSVVSINSHINKCVSPTTPRLFSPVPYSRSCHSFFPVNWQNPSKAGSSTELKTEDKEIDDGNGSTLPICMEEKTVEEPLYLDEGQSNDEPIIKADKGFEVKSSDDNQIITGVEHLEEENVIDVQIISEEPGDIEVDDGHNPTESSSSEEWLIDQYNPLETRSLKDEWTKKRSEDYQNSLKRPLTTIPEEDGDSTSNTPSLSKAYALNDIPENVNDRVNIELVNESKSPLLDSLEEFVLLEKYFTEEENRRQELLTNMMRSEKSDCSGLTKCDEKVKKADNAITEVIKHVKEKQPTNDKETKKATILKEVNKATGDVSSKCTTEQSAGDCVNYELTNKRPLRDSLEEFVILNKYFSEEENRSQEQPISMKLSEKLDCSGLTKCDEEVKKPKNSITEVLKHAQEKQPSNDVETKKAAVLKEINATGDIREMDELKKVFENYLKEKEEFESMLEKQGNDLKRHLREMDQAMEAVQNEHIDIEKVTGDFEGTMNIYNNYKNKVASNIEHNLEQELSSGMSRNSNLVNELRDLNDDIEDIKERRPSLLKGINHNIDDMKRDEDLLKEENDEIEADKKRKMEEFNEIRMNGLGKSKIYAEKDTVVKGFDTVGFPNAVQIASPSSETPKKHSSGLAINLTEVENKPPDIKTPRKDTYKKRQQNDELPKPGSMQSTDNDDEKQIIHRFADGKVKISGGREGRSKIPKPISKIYGSDSRDYGRYQISYIDSTKVTQSKNYKRNTFVPENQRHVTKSTKENIKKDNVSRLKDIHYQAGDVEFAEKFSVGGKGCHSDVKSINVSLDKNKKESGRKGISLPVDRHKMNSLQKPAVVPKRLLKKEIKSKIDTGLKRRPVKQENLSNNKKDSKKTNTSVRSGTAKSRRREVSYVKDMTWSLPPLKEAHKESDIPRSPAFGDKAPLPGIQPLNQKLVNKAPLPEIRPSKQQLVNKNNVCEKKAVTRQVLPPIKPPNAGRLPASEKDNKRQQVSSKKQAPNAIWITFSPTPPPTPPTNKARTTRRRKTPDTERSIKRWQT